MARAIVCFRAAVAESDSLADPKPRGFFLLYHTRSLQELHAFLSLGERVAACGDGACASDRRSDRGSESNFGLSSFRGWSFCELISLTSLIFLNYRLVKLVRRSWQELPVLPGSWSQALRWSSCFRPLWTEAMEAASGTDPSRG